MNKPRQSGYRKLLLSSALVLSGVSAMASHFMYGNVSYEAVPGSPYSVEFTVTQAFHLHDLPAGATVGSPYSEQTRLITGRYGANNSSAYPVITLTIDRIDPVDSFFYGHYTYVEHYPTGGPATYTAYLQDAGRLHNLQNNADKQFRVSSTVKLNLDNDAPATSINPVITLPANDANAQFALGPVVTDDGGNLVYSLTPAGQFGAGTVQPAGLSVSSIGVLTFNTVGKLPGQLYNTSVTITDAAGAQVQLDFIIRISGANSVNTPPFFVYCTPAPCATATPSNNGTVNGTTATGATFTVKADDNDNGDLVTINKTAGLGSFTISPVVGNPATGTFVFPAGQPSGIYLVSFRATDNDNQSATTNVYVNISNGTCPAAPAVTFSASGTTGGCMANTYYKGYSQPIMLSAKVPAPASPTTAYTYKFLVNGSVIATVTKTGSNVATATYTPSATSGHLVFTVQVEYAPGCFTFGGTNGAAGITFHIKDVRCGNKMDKVLVCHNTGSNSNPRHNICVSPNAVPAHVNNHGDCIGDCDDLHGHSHARMASTPEDVPVFDEDQAIIVYPNPARNTVHFVYRDMESDYHSFSVSDLSGRMITEGGMADKRAGKISLDVSRYAPGIYMLRVINETGTYVSKFVVE